MALTEAQITRYARHILLPEVGGIGQERLLASEVRLWGESVLAELAGDYLSAAGVRVDAHSGKGLVLKLADGAQVRVISQANGAHVVSGPCEVCATQADATSSGETSAVAGAIAASLAASEALRLILGIGEKGRRWRVLESGELEALPFVPCAEHGGPR